MGKKNKKYTIEEVKDFTKNKGYEVLDKKYVNIKTKMEFKCIKCGHIIIKSFDNFKNNKNNCPNCKLKKSNKLNKPKSQIIYTPEKIKKFVEENNIELIKILKGTGVYSQVLLKCKKCNHEFIRMFYVFKDKPSCPKCRVNPRRTKYEDIKKFVEIDSKSGCKFLETKESYKKKCLKEPKMALCKLKFQCKCGNEFEISFNTFKSGDKRKCNECSYKATGVGRRYTYEEVKKYIEVESDSGCKLLSKTYEDNHKPLHLKCSCGNDFYRALAEFKYGLFKCKKCTGATTKYTYEEVCNDLKEHNIKLLSKEYINYSKKMKIRYICGFEADRNYYNIKKSDYKCPHCNKKGYGRDTEQLFKEIDEITNGEYILLSEYKTMNDKVLIKHNKCGNAYEVTPHNFLDSGNRCPICGISHHELYINDYLIKNNIPFVPQYEFDGLIGLGGGNLKFDFAIFNDKEKTDLKCLIEYDGEFHYFPIIDEEQLKKQQIHDKRKNKYCNQNNIKLVRIPYWESDNLVNILDGIFILKQFDN
ncbi:hypothetical protein EJM73_08280 [Clostridium botulinum]|uniref:hypothetical protein n=1 Tax=Clostridium botulinum TaxID=1491 RepID=UPI00137561D5|nr:hypothetical protein [Clostridium botulinum]NCI19896.1 hypothetical protein [Clostridium botulinum]NCI35658.1 hypothetical protein [Clostridium botulinum]NCI71791.1 hypothetical protein [Clostridium botulinum]NDI38707.1 hypothetical protein [Clostridium botulinum]